MEWLADPQAWVALATLTALEIVLGIDNIIFISVLVSRLPPEQRQRARMLGLGFAMGTRILLLFMLVWIMGLTQLLFSVLDFTVTGRDIILLGGGLNPKPSRSASRRQSAAHRGLARRGGWRSW